MNTHSSKIRFLISILYGQSFRIFCTYMLLLFFFAQIVVKISMSAKYGVKRCCQSCCNERVKWKNKKIPKIHYLGANKFLQDVVLWSVTRRRKTLVRDDVETAIYTPAHIFCVLFFFRRRHRCRFCTCKICTFFTCFLVCVFFPVCLMANGNRNGIVEYIKSYMILCS